MTEIETTTKNKYCPSCGDAVSEPAAFCGTCGTSLAVGASTQSVAGGPSQPSQPSQPAAAPAQAPPPARAAPQAPAVAPPPAAGEARPAPPPPGPPSAAAPPGPAQTHAGAATVPHASPPPAAPGGRKWVPYAVVGGAVLLLAAIVVTLLLVLSGSPGSNVKVASATQSDVQKLLAAQGTTIVSPAAPGLFAFVQANRLQALVPAGWRATAQAGTGIGRAQFVDPKQSSNTLAIVDQTGSNGGDHAGAVLARTDATARGYPVAFFGQVRFPGGRPAWRVTYTAGGVTHSIYFFQACNGNRSEVVHVSVPSQAFAKQAATLGVLAASVEPLC